MASAAPRMPRARFGMWLLAGVILAALAVVLARGLHRPAGGQGAVSTVTDGQARRFVALALALGELRPGEVDGYFGPPLENKSAPPPLPQLREEVAELATELDGGPADDRRRLRLAGRTRHMLALIDTLAASKPLPFDEEARSLYGLQPAKLDEARFASARAELDRLLPGSGSLTERVQAFRMRYLIPERLRPTLFERALVECRRRTAAHWQLPTSERLDTEWVSGPDAAWHRYTGGFHSNLRVNAQGVAFIGSAIDVACHEAYPGHHSQFLLAEQAAGPAGLPLEDKLVVLRSPGSVLREGAADYGVALAFPAADRLAFERDVLFPLAGLSADNIEWFEQVRGLLDRLAPAALPILRDYRDGRIDAATAAAALDSKALIVSPESLIAFVDNNGAYVSGYTAVREQVRAAVEGAGGDRWATLRCLLLHADEAPLASGVCTSSTRKADQ